MRVAVFGTIVFLVILVTSPASVREVPANGTDETAADFVVRLQDLLRGQRLDAYLEAFEPGLRTAERERLGVFFDDLAMTGVTLRVAGARTAGTGPDRAFVQAFFENDFSAVIESWTLTLGRRGGSLSVAGLDVTGGLTRLYKVRIPGDRAVRARRVEVTHADIRFAFEDASVFYDNIPGLETALVVIGRGRVDFRPSDRNEQHQLDLIYGKDRIEDAVESLFIRGSAGFFDANVVVDEWGDGSGVSADDRDRAAAVFSRNYPRSYTIESSIDGALLSYLPQADEAVLEFQARKAGELAYIFYPYSDDEVSLYDRGKERVVCLYAPAAEPALKRMFLSFEEKFDISACALDLSLTPSSFYLSARARIEVVPKVELLESLRFRFNAGLEILKITDEAGRELFHTTDKLRQILYVHFLSPPAMARPTTIEIIYRGRVPPVAPTADVVGQTGLNERIRVQPRYESWLYSHNGYWYPGPSDEDYFRARLTVSVPPEYSCVASGEMVAWGRREDLGDVAAIEKAGNAVYTFDSSSPVKYISFIVGKFDTKRERPTPVPIATHVSSEVLDSRPALVDQAAGIIDFYSRAFGPYPYEKLDIVLRLWPVYGGHSPPSFIVMNEVPWLGNTGFPVPVDTPVDLSSWDEYFLAHEIAHQWWGQGVSFDSYKDQWLSEGMSQFAAASYLKHAYGDGAFAAILKKFARWTGKKSFRGPVIMGSRLSYYDFAAYQTIVYNKAALVLFMLQDLLGRETFEAGLRSFFASHLFGAARTGEFIDALEAMSGRDLDGFFQGWFYDWELPDVRTGWTATPVAEGFRVDLRIAQIKGLFVFPLWVEWTRGKESGRTLVIVDEAVETASFILPERPKRVRFNPDRAVPGKFS
ncbi:MAG: hypothetical protein JW775_12785 [Candidatus Aminicenantes bacterium]|nr:hypothetical protein [Candidatus Aminicenantes bacterium]